MSDSAFLDDSARPLADGLSRRVLLTRTLLAGTLGAGTLLLGRAARGSPAWPPHVELSQPGVGHERDWVRLRLGVDGAAAPTPIALPGRGESTLRVSNTTGLVSVSDRADSGERRDGQRRGGGPRTMELSAPAGGSRQVWLTPQRAGSPGVPADRLVMESSEGRSEVDVWVEPKGGQWLPAGNEGSPLDLQIVAVHGALVRKDDGAEVIMYSLARERDAWGDPMKDPDRPGQWLWNIFSQDDLESRALDLGELTTRDRPMRPEEIKNIFCSGQAILPDGRLLTIGGHGTDNNDVHNSDHAFIYDPNAESGWTRLGWKLDPHRWYPTVTALPDGRMLIASGSQVLPTANPNIDHGPEGFWNKINNDYQIFDPAQPDSVVVPPGNELVDQQQLDALNDGVEEILRHQQLATYPSVFVAPGKTDADTVIVIAESNRAWLCTYHPEQKTPLARGGRLYPMNTIGSRSYPHYGSSALLPLEPKSTRARVLVVGGQHEKNPEHRSFDGQQPATDTAEIFDLDTSKGLEQQDGWRAAGRMAHPRVLSDATLLADGQVLVSGGSKKGWGDENYEAVFDAELFDPVTEKFSLAAKAATDRRYHSIALLQPDGTVLKAGSTGGFGDHANNTADRMVAHTTAERYYPPYCFQPRPSIVEVGGVAPPAGAVLRHGEQFTVTAAGKILDDEAQVSIIRPGAVTHGANMDQRYVWLEAVDRKEGDHSWDITAVMPANPAAAPPGDYLLVVVASNGVPSPAAFVRLKK